MFLWTPEIGGLLPRSFIKKHFLADIADSDAYEVVFNLRSLDPDRAAGLIIDAYRHIVGL